MFEGLFGPKDSGSSEFIEGIIEEIDKAKESNDQKQYVQTIFNRLYFDEPQHLLKSHGGRLERDEKDEEAKGQESSEKITKEEKEEISKFLAKINTMKFEQFKPVSKESKFSVTSLSMMSDLSLNKLSVDEWFELFVITIKKI